MKSDGTLDIHIFQNFYLLHDCRHDGGGLGLCCNSKDNLFRRRGLSVAAKGIFIYKEYTIYRDKKTFIKSQSIRWRDLNVKDEKRCVQMA